MDAGLLGWGRAVKQRRKSRLPVLWLFTDAERLADPLPAIAQLPKGWCGVVLRQRDPVLARQVARLCRKRRLALVVAGDARLAAAIGAGVHLRGGRQVGFYARRGPVTASAHDVPELVRARRAKAEIVFISPVFLTKSHPGERGLGVVKWLKIARLSGDAKPYALGGITGKNINLLSRFCAGVGAISALMP